MIGGEVTLLAIVSAAAWGLGYFGQPHIIVRFMAIRDVKQMPVARRINMGWMAISLIGAILTGLIGAAWFAARGGAPADAETVFLLLSKILFHPFIAGFVLAAVLAAIMSTISSQLLVTSSSLTEDIYKTFLKRSASETELVTIGRLAVVAVAIVAGLLAMDPDSSILGIVGNAWAGFGAAFGPAILFSLRWKRTTREGVLAGMIVGALVVIVWTMPVFMPGTDMHRQIFELGNLAPEKLGDGLALTSALYGIVPGFIASSLAIWLVSKATAAPDPAIGKQFDEAAAAAKGA
jgi:SSS family solute:Na+ symporter